MTFGKRLNLANPPAVEAFIKDFLHTLQNAGFTSDSGATGRWRGVIQVDWRDTNTGAWNTSSHSIEIFLVESFPYQAPVVFCKDDPPLRPSWHLSPYKTLCLWRNPDGWKPFTGALFFLERIREWFRNYHTGIWPNNFAPTDLHLYLNEEGRVVLGDEWDPSAGKESGRFVIWGNQDYSNVPWLVGLISTNGKPQREPRLADRLTSIPGGAGRYPGIWFRVKAPFVPANRLLPLLGQIDQYSDKPDGTALSNLLDLTTRFFSGKGIPISIGYPENNDTERWLFLWVNNPKGKKIHFTNLDEANLEIRSFETYPAGKKDLLRRTAHINQSLIIKKVALFGVGALGGSVALLLAKAGVGNIRLIDGDDVKPVNVVRHVAGLSNAGISKTISVKNVILDHSPDCIVEIFTETNKADEINKIILGCDLVIDTTANQPFSLYLNQLVVQNRVPLLHAAAFRRATIGRMIFNRADPSYNDPCLACYRLNNTSWDEHSFPIIPIDPTSFFEEEGCAAVTEEADAIHVELLASQCALLAVQFLNGQRISGNLFLTVNNPINGAKNVLGIQGMHKIENTALPHCEICHWT